MGIPETVRRRQIGSMLLHYCWRIEHFSLARIRALEENMVL
jgi:hypothetical protein